jgi:sarcosine oxidase, subunit alpha
VATRLGPPSDTVEVTHDGDSITARRGEPLALTLIAADRLLLSRSPKLHRPRGPYCLRGACEGCLVRVNGIPNQPACRVLVQGGERVETQNVLGSRETDLLSAADFLFPQGIDHHRLLTGLPGLSGVVSNFARRIAGLGRLAEVTPDVQPAELPEVALLVVGGGASGLAAAEVFGTRATLVDDGATLGGALTALAPRRAVELTRRAEQSGATLHPRSTVAALTREPDDGSGRLTALVVGPERTRVFRCRAVLLAPGRHDAAPPFANNDLPGIFSARAALTAWHADVLIGKKLAVVGQGVYANALMEQLSGAVPLVQLDTSSVVRAVGRERIAAVEVELDGRSRRIQVDALAFDGAGAPSFELAVQGGGAVDFDAASGYHPRVTATGQVAERLFFASSASQFSREAIEALLD